MESDSGREVVVKCKAHPEYSPLALLWSLSSAGEASLVAQRFLHTWEAVFKGATSNQTNRCVRFFRKPCLVMGKCERRVIDALRAVV